MKIHFTDFTLRISEKQKRNIILLINFFYISLWTYTAIKIPFQNYALDMDERISYLGIKNILDSESTYELFWNVIDGQDQRYGRLFWYAGAIFSYFPHIIFGSEGQIIATRLLQILALSISFNIIIFKFLNYFSTRIIFLLLLYSLPFSDYFATLPKPEPLQLLFLVFFLYKLKSENINSNFYWIYLGIAMGLKISVITFGVTSFLFFLYQFKPQLSQLIKIFNFILIGFIISIPLLIPFYLILYLLYELIYFNLNKILKNFFNLSIFVLLFFVIKYSTLTKILEYWLNWTFFNSTHGSDESNLNLRDWTLYYINDWSSSPLIIKYLLIFISFFLILLIIFSKIEFTKLNFEYFLIISGVVSIATIFISVNRTWGHYLYLGNIIFLLGLFKLINHSPEIYKKIKNFFIYGKVLFYISFIIMLSYWVQNSIINLYNYSRIQFSSNFLLKQDIYNKLILFTEDFSSKNEIPLKIIIDPLLFLPSNSKTITYSQFWGPFDDWDSGYDIIILSSTNYPLKCDLGKENYKKCDLAQKNQDRSIIRVNSMCFNDICYRIVNYLPKGATIFVKDGLEFNAQS